MLCRTRLYPHNLVVYVSIASLLRELVQHAPDIQNNLSEKRHLIPIYYSFLPAYKGLPIQEIVDTAPEPGCQFSCYAQHERAEALSPSFSRSCSSSFLVSIPM